MAQSGDDEGGDDGGGRQTERPEARVAEPDPVSPAGRLVFDLIYMRPRRVESVSI